MAGRQTAQQVVEDSIEHLYKYLVKMYNLDEAKAKELIKEEVEYLINNK